MALEIGRRLVHASGAAVPAAYLLDTHVIETGVVTWSAVQVLAVAGLMVTVVLETARHHDRSNWVDPVNPGITPADDDFGTKRLLGDPASDDFPIGDASYVFDVNGPWVRAGDSKIQGYTAEVTVGECGNAFVMGHRDPWVLSRGYEIEYRQTGGSWQIIGPEDLSAEDPTTLGCEAPSPPSVDLTTRIGGRVFNDNGLNSATGGIAHDGEVNGDEAGLGGVAVKALDNCQPGDVLAETTTNGDGEWSLSLSVDDEGKGACLVAETPDGFRAISESDGTADSDITLNALDDAEMTFAVPAPGTVWDGINFGKVGSPRLVPDNQGSVTPGNVIDYRHQFTAATAGEVAFSLANPTSTPDSPAWRQQVYPDPSCSGEADFSAPLTVNVEAEEQRCLLVRVFAPADAPTGAQHSVALTATQTLTLDDNSTVTDSVAVTDITRVQTGQLGLEKRVRNIGVDGEPDTTDDGDSDFQTRNQGEPCDVLRYEIRYTNTGTTPMADLEVNDATPAFTSLAAQAECPASVALPGNLTSCTLATPAGTNAVGYQGSVAWQFDGQLAPGAQGTVHYDVRIEGACH
ncbi:MAG: hypothetical protein R6U42_03215 [Halomonas sp.]